MPSLVRFGIGAVGREPGSLPLMIVGPLRQPPLYAKPIEDLPVFWLSAEPFRVQLPKLDEGTVEIGKMLLGVEHRKGRCQPVEASRRGDDCLLRLRRAAS